jgi:hypothetical protein
MTTLDNLMTGRTVHVDRGFFWQLLRHGPAQTEEIARKAVIANLTNAQVRTFWTNEYDQSCSSRTVSFASVVMIVSVRITVPSGNLNPSH